MGGHGDHHGHVKVNEYAVKEKDEDLVYKIRTIELIKHNPNLFHLWIWNPSNWYNVLGGTHFLLSTGLGGAIGWWYFAQKLKYNSETYYSKMFKRSARVGLGLFLGAVVGYFKFADRQRLHNAWVAERLRRRYPESLNLDTTDLYRFKGIKSTQEYYKWT